MVQRLASPKPEESAQSAVCCHYWFIEAAAGPVSRGVCQLCDEVRDFENFVEAAPQGDDAPAVSASSRYPTGSSQQDDADSEQSDD